MLLQSPPKSGSKNVFLFFKNKIQFQLGLQINRS